MPHLVYLLTLYPIMAVTSLLLYVVHMPFSVLFFASSGYKLFLPFIAGLRNVSRYCPRTHTSYSGPHTSVLVPPHPRASTPHALTLHPAPRTS